ncbi:hypothetical protein Hanom_Chr13g01244321 [Helianthus anomalus]
MGFSFLYLLFVFGNHLFLYFLFCLLFFVAFDVYFFYGFYVILLCKYVLFPILIFLIIKSNFSLELSQDVDSTLGNVDLYVKCCTYLSVLNV